MVEALASGSCRASANIMAMACSAVVIELPNGVFITTTPRWVAAGTSTLSTPIAGAADDLEPGRGGQHLLGHLGGRADGEAVILGDDGLQLVGLESVRTSTSTPRSRKMATAAGLRLSEMRTLGMGSAPEILRHPRESGNLDGVGLLGPEEIPAFAGMTG